MRNRFVGCLPIEKSIINQCINFSGKTDFTTSSGINLLASGVALAACKLPILMNVKCCSCLFYKFSPLSDNYNEMRNFNTNV
jgi:hypothetical protein